MAVRTISRDAANPRVVLVWPANVSVDAVKTNDRGANYAYGDDGALAVPAQIPSDVFKAAFGFIPLTGNVDRYLMRKAHAPETTETKLTNAIKALVKDVLDNED